MNTRHLSPPRRRALAGSRTAARRVLLAVVLAVVLAGPVALAVPASAGDAPVSGSAAAPASWTGIVTGWLSDLFEPFVGTDAPPPAGEQPQSVRGGTGPNWDPDGYTPGPSPGQGGGGVGGHRGR